MLPSEYRPAFTMLISAIHAETNRSTRTKQEYVPTSYHRYRGARRPAKQRILGKFREMTQQHRKPAIWLRSGPVPGAARPPRDRDLPYGQATIDAPQKVWGTTR